LDSARQVITAVLIVALDMLALPRSLAGGVSKQIDPTCDQ